MWVVSESLHPVHAALEPARYVPISLMSAASAHTLRPKIEKARSVFRTRQARKLSLKIIALVGISVTFGVAGAANDLSHLRTRPAALMQVVSGNPMLKKGADGDSVRWHSRSSKIYFDSSLDDAGPHTREVVQLAFGTWIASGARLPHLDFDSTKGARFGQVPNGKSEVMYGPITLAGHENDLALTVTFSDPKTGEVVESDMIFNSRHPFGILPYTPMGSTELASMGHGSDCDHKYDLQSVATHEVGHFFGLGEDFDDKPSTMYYTTGRCETNKRVLHGSDEDTMNALYLLGQEQASVDDSETAKGCGGARIGQGQTQGSVPWLALVGLLGFVAFRRRQR